MSGAENQSTGFSWIIREENSAIYQVVDDQYRDPKLAIPGAPGTRTFTIKGIKKGTATVELVNVQPWNFDGWDSIDPNSFLVGGYAKFTLRVI